MDNTVQAVIENLRYRSRQFLENPKAGQSVTDIEKQRRKFAFLDKIVAEHDQDKNKKKNPLSRIIRGFLNEFIRRSEQQIPELNIEHGRNPKAAEYWADHPEGLEAAKAGGLFQAAVSFRKFEKLYGREGGRDAEFNGVAEIIGSSVYIFRQLYPKLDPINPPLPSVYNDLRQAVKYASIMRDWDRAMGR